MLRILLIFATLLFTTCGGEKGKTPVTFKLSGDGETANKILTKLNDARVFAVALGPDIDPPISQELQEGDASIVLEVPNGLNRRFRVVAYVESLFEDNREEGETEQSEPPEEGEEEFEVIEDILFAGGRYFEDVSDPVNLTGEPVEIGLTLAEVTDLVAIQASIVGQNVNDADDFTSFTAAMEVVDRDTGFVYPPMLPTAGLAKVYPPALVRGKVYILRANLGSTIVERPFTIPDEVEFGFDVDPLIHPFDPHVVSTEAQLVDAINNANNSDGIDFIDIVPESGPSSTIILNDPLPALIDDAGVVIRGRGFIEINGSGLPSLGSGLVIASNNNFISNLEFKDFPEFGVVISRSDIAPTQFNLIEDCLIIGNLAGGVLVEHALFSFIGPRNRIINNEPFGVRFDSDAAFAIVFDSIIKGPSAPSGATSCISVTGGAAGIGIGDRGFESKPGESPGGNIITNCVYGVEIRDTAEDVSVEGNNFGIDTELNIFEPNSVGVLADTSGEVRVLNNQFICNGEFPVMPDCPSPASFPPLPGLFSGGGGVVVTENNTGFELLRNEVSLNTHGIFFTQNVQAQAGDFGFRVDHNTFYKNDTGVYVGANSSSIELTNNIISHSDCVSFCHGTFFDTGSTLEFALGNLLFNFQGLPGTPLKQDCVHADGGGLCASLIENSDNIECSDSTAATAMVCDPLFNDLGNPLNLDLGVASTSPAVDNAGPDTGFGPPVQGAAPDIGALESH